MQAVHLKDVLDRIELTDGSLLGITTSAKCILVTGSLLQCLRGCGV
jgi:hypothetical protein